VFSAPRFAIAQPSLPPGLDAFAGLRAYRPAEILSLSSWLPAQKSAQQPGEVPPLAAGNSKDLNSSSCSTADTAELDARSVPDAEEGAQQEGPPGVRRQPLSLEAALTGVVPALGSPELPTEGSRGHGVSCKPCAFVFKGGCNSGVQCKFCHLCPAEEKKMRKKQWREQKRVAGTQVGLVQAATAR